LAGADLQGVPWLQGVNLAAQWAPLPLIRRAQPLIRFAQGGSMPRASPWIPSAVVELLQRSL